MKRVLVVDDEFDMAGTVRAVLEGEGYQVETCADSRQAVQRAREAPPDLILMDVMMPVLSGFEVLRALRGTPGLDRVPVVLMSSIVAGVKRDEYQWQAFLSKPFSLDALLKTVEQLIGKADAGSSRR